MGSTDSGTQKVATGVSLLAYGSIGWIFDGAAVL